MYEKGGDIGRGVGGSMSNGLFSVKVVGIVV